MKKLCGACKTEKPLSEFHVNKANRDGLATTCKECRRTYNKDWRSKNKEHVLGYGRAYYADNKERVLEYSKTYYDDNKDRILERVKQYNQTESGKSRSKQRKKVYGENNPQKIKAKSAVNRAVRTGRLKSINDCDCQVCGKQAQHYHHWSYDRIHWLHVIPLCVKCHVKIHRDNGNEME